MNLHGHFCLHDIGVIAVVGWDVAQLAAMWAWWNIKTRFGTRWVERILRS